MIKGYTGFVGRALVAIKACELAADHLREYEVIIYSASLKARIRALKLRHKHKIHVTILKKRTPHHEMLKHFLEARVYIGISLSDGISTSLLEAMATGSYPIQTNTSCASEWLTPTSGSIVPADDIARVSTELINALNSDHLVDRAANVNQDAISNHALQGSIVTIAKTFYALF